VVGRKNSVINSSAYAARKREAFVRNGVRNNHVAANIALRNNSQIACNVDKSDGPILGYFK